MVHAELKPQNSCTPQNHMLLACLAAILLRDAMLHGKRLDSCMHYVYLSSWMFVLCTWGLGPEILYAEITILNYGVGYGY